MKSQIGVLESVLLVLWVGYLVWQCYGIQFLAWWKARGQKVKRGWTWRPRTPSEVGVVYRSRLKRFEGDSGPLLATPPAWLK